MPQESSECGRPKPLLAVYLKVYIKPVKIEPWNISNELETRSHRQTS